MTEPGNATPRQYRCAGCGNITRFDVIATRRVQEFHHFTVGGDLEIETAEVLDEQIEQVLCRWCGASGPQIEVIREARL